ncbi:MAG: stage V sporulation protein AB [Lachnospiraceae bacterium]|nr:stage V sporulation protein AB [Lachnospiraceae bacterium]
MWIKYILMAIIGLAAGGVIAGAYVAFIASLGVYTRLEGWAKTGKKTLRIETLILLGTTLGNLMTLYEIPIPVGQVGLAVCGLFFGMFTGCLAAALADVVKLFPILCRRVGLRKGLPYIIAAVGIGKAVGNWLQFFCLKSPQ